MDKAPYYPLTGETRLEAANLRGGGVLYYNVL